MAGESEYVYTGRARQQDVVRWLFENHILKDGEIVEGNYGDGKTAYLSFYTEKTGFTCRTSSDGRIDVNRRMLERNLSFCQEAEKEHTLLLAFYWPKFKVCMIPEDGCTEITNFKKQVQKIHFFYGTLQKYHVKSSL